MVPYFNTAGPCVAGQHYMLSPEERFGRVIRLVDEGKYFTLHAGRQTGKTTNARWLVKQLNASDQCCGIWVDVQTARDQPDLSQGMRELLFDFERALCRDLPELSIPTREEIEDLLLAPGSALLVYLQRVCATAPLPLVVLVDEADGLVGRTMVSFLTQIRAGYLDRSDTPFPQSLALIGMRQVRDYAISSEEQREVRWLGTTSPFNITAEAATLEPFSPADVTDLLGQHTEQKGQRFEKAAVEAVFHLSQGHPWLVNALADQIVDRDVEDRTVPITAAHVEAAKEQLITDRRTHIDSLVARLREPRVLKIIEPMLTGGTTGTDVLDDDFAYVRGLGLIVEQDRRYLIANPIYREVIPRALTHIKEKQIPHETAWYIGDDGSLDLSKLMTAWQKFWRIDGHLAAEGFHYREAGPHLMLMAFLQRIVNGGGRIEREYGLGRGAVDLMVLWNNDRHIIEVKLRRDTETEDEALDQILRYLDQTGLDEGWLVLFDLRSSRSWKEKTFVRDERVQGRLVHVVGC